MLFTSVSQLVGKSYAKYLRQLPVVVLVLIKDRYGSEVCGNIFRDFRCGNYIKTAVEPTAEVVEWAETQVAHGEVNVLGQSLGEFTLNLQPCFVDNLCSPGKPLHLLLMCK